MNRGRNIKELSRLISKRVGNNSIEEIITDLYKVGALEDNRVMRTLIKSEYMKRYLQGGASGNSIKIALAVEFDCSISHVNNCIYKRDIKI